MTKKLEVRERQKMLMYANYLEDTGKSGFAVTDKLCGYIVAKGRRGIDYHI